MHDTFETLRETARQAPPVDLRRDEPVWLFGAGAFGQAACGALREAGYAVAGFVETRPRHAMVLGLPVRSWDDPPVGRVAITIFNRDAPFDALANFAAARTEAAVLSPTQVYELAAQTLGWRYWLSKRESLLAHVDRVAAVAARMADDESRICMARILAFRLGLDPAYASHRDGDRQYFNELTLSAPGRRPFTYVDCGAYNGDTFIDLMDHAPGACDRACLLEPDPANFARLAEVARGFKVPATCLPLAASDRSGLLTFSAGQGEASRVGEAGGTQVAAIALDDLLPNERVGFLKLDVEGAEAEVLKGARRLVGRSRPVIALSLYHNPQDLWALPELLFTMCEGYRFHVRQHQYNSFDSVLYAVPD